MTLAPSTVAALRESVKRIAVLLKLAVLCTIAGGYIGWTAAVAFHVFKVAQ